VRFIIGRLVLQTDLVMVAHLGTAATAAFAIPVRIMLMDVVCAYALAPLISANAAECEGDATKAAVATRQSLSLAALLAAALTIMGLIIYPLLVRAVAPDAEVAALAQRATFWLTLAIPFRLPLFVATMILHGLGKGSRTVYIGIIELLVNATLNWFFIYYVKMGFSGSYVSTFVTSGIALALALVIVSRTIGTWSLFGRPDGHWLGKILPQAGAEAGRISAERGVDCAALMVVAESGQQALGAFAVGCEFLFLLGAPIVATMRAAVILLVRRKSSALRDAFSALARVTAVTCALSMAGGALLMLAEPILSTNLYKLDPVTRNWWMPLALMLPIILPITMLGALWASAFHALRRFGLLAALQIPCWYGLLLPALYLGAHLCRPWLLWGAYPLCNLAFLGAVSWVALREARQQTRDLADRLATQNKL
jgi:Na+-driven multidrug efflux pump